MTERETSRSERGDQGHIVLAVESRAAKVFGTSQAAREWLHEECPALGFARPVDLLKNKEGLDKVMKILARIERNTYT